MNHLKLVPSTSNLLTIEALPISDPHSVPNTVIFSMFYVMHTNRGIGLSGCQIGYPYQIFVTEVPGDEPRVFINPEITWWSSDFSEEEEGCLSFPGIIGLVKRPLSIKIKATSSSNEEFELEATGLLSRCIQHEFDHLQSRVFTSRFS
jgi:peptide deformylase